MFSQIDFDSDAIALCVSSEPFYKPSMCFLSILAIMASDIVSIADIIEFYRSQVYYSIFEIYQ